MTGEKNEEDQDCPHMMRFISKQTIVQAMQFTSRNTEQFSTVLERVACLWARRTGGPGVRSMVATSRSVSYFQ